MSTFGVPPVPPPPGAWLAPTPSGPIEQDVACRKCSYNLRGLTADGRCPECGTAVGYSLQGDLLRFCDPNWVETLRRGAVMFIWGIVLIFVGILGAIALAVSTESSSALVFGRVVVVLGYILSTIGWWLLTQPDPSGLGEDRYGTARKIIRVSLIVGVAQSVLSVILLTVRMEDSLIMLLSIAILAAEIVMAIGLFAQCYYLERIALRIPDDKLSQRSHFLMYALGITYTVVQAIKIINALTGAAIATSSSSSGLAGFGLLLTVLLIVFFVMYLFLIEKMGKRFKEQARIARSSWAATAFTPGASPV